MEISIKNIIIFIQDNTFENVCKVYTFIVEASVNVFTFYELFCMCMLMGWYKKEVTPVC